VFQGLDASPAYLTIGALKAYIDHRLLRLVREPEAGFTERDRQDVLTHIDALGSLVQENELDEVPVHADMALGNLLVAGSRIVVLDFAMTNRGSRLLDLTRLFVQMDLLTVKPHVHRALVHRLQQSMIAGFDSTLTQDRPLFRLLLLLHRINHLATLSVNPAPFLENLYNGLVKKHHRRWLTAEMQRGALRGVET
jgi:Ser/Thr protein kinase RdoA (MazF antagonist)